MDDGARSKQTRNSGACRDQRRKAAAAVRKNRCIGKRQEATPITVRIARSATAIEDAAVA